MTLRISKMFGKLLGIDGINTNTLSNDFCKKCHESNNKDLICTKCYSHYMLTTFRQNCVNSWQHNSKLLSESLLSIRQIESIKFKHKYVRINAHGELINNIHLINLIRICNGHKDHVFSIWTKRLDIINKVFDQPLIKKPSNLIIVYSNPLIDAPINTIDNKYVDKVFNVVHELFLDKLNCNGKKCINCKLCYTKNDTNIIYERLRINSNVNKTK